MFSQLFVAAFLAVSAQTALAADCTRSYTIQAGDYCDKISQAQNVSTYQLAVVNSGSVNSACTNLIPGQSLCLAQKATEDCSTTYVVLADDTCAGIASKNALNTTILSLNNPQIDDACSNIYPGEVLCTSKTVQVPPVPASGVTVVATATTFTVTPKVTPVAAGTPAAAAKSTPTITAAAAASTDAAGDDSTPDGDSDDDLPFCDEL